MGDDGVIHKLFNIKALLGIVAGAGASYGLYKLLSSGNGGQRIKDNITGDFKRVVDSSNYVGRTERSACAVQPGTLLARVSSLSAVSGTEGVVRVSSSDVVSKSSRTLDWQDLEKLLSLLQMSTSASNREQVLITLGNAAAFSVNQDFIRELGGLHIIAGSLSDPVPEIRVQALNALNNLSMNVTNQEQLKVYIPQVFELIEISPVNSDLQLACLRLLTNLSVTNYHHHLFSSSVTLLLSLLVVSSETLQIQVLKVLVNLSTNPDMIENIVQAQAPASLVLLFDSSTHPDVLQRLLLFVENLRGWHVLSEDGGLRRSRDSVYRVLLAEGTPLQHRLPLLLAHPDPKVKEQVAHLLT